MTLATQIRDALQRAQDRLGRKNLAPMFDGNEGKSVAETTVTKWIKDARRFPVIHLPVLVQADRKFGRYLLHAIPSWMGLHDQALKELDPKTAQQVRVAFEKVIVGEMGYPVQADPESVARASGQGATQEDGT